MKAIKVGSISVWFAGALGMMTLAGAAFGQSDTPSPCASVSDDKSRLQCYDAQEKMRKGQSASPQATEPSTPAQASATAERSPPPEPAQASTPPMPRQAPLAATASAAVEPGAAAEAPTPAPQAPVGQASSNEFGLTSEALRKKRAAAAPEGTSAEEQQQVGRVKSVKGLRKGDYRIELENGQIWEETQRTGGDPPEVGETVTIRRASLGSYFLSRQSGLALRVKRIQ